MPVTVTVSTQALTDPAVHHALSRLIDAVAQHRVRQGAPNPVASPEHAEARYARFVDALPERSRQFLALVEEKGVLGIAEAMTALSVPVGKAMGGITGSIARWAPEYDVSVPFEAIKGADGQRAWRWIGLNRTPAPPVPVRRRRRPSSQPQAAATAPTPPPAASAGATAEVLAELPDDAARLLKLLQERGTVSRSEALAALGLARAQALGRVVAPLEAALSRHGIADRLERAVDPLGDWTWSWTELDADAPEATPPSSPLRQRPPTN